jgi:hypothetical protein
MSSSQIEQPAVTCCFVRPCLACGVTVRVVHSVAQPHDCECPKSLAEVVARAWWAGYDTAGEQQ